MQYTNETDALAALKQVMELNNGGLFWNLLNKQENHHFYPNTIKKAKNAYFNPDGSTIQWVDKYVCNQLKDEEGHDYYEFIADVSVSGIVSEYNNRGITFFSTPAQFNFSIHAFVFKDFGVNNDDIRLLGDEQKSLLLFHKHYELETHSLGIESINDIMFDEGDAFGFFTRIWKNVNRTDQTMVSDTSLHFFNEFVECHRNIRYSVACANMWGRYKTHYSSHSYHHQSTIVYPVQMKYYDYRFFFYLENAIEEIYTFYERFAYLFFLFVKPLSFNDRALSFQKLFEGKIRKEIIAKFPVLDQEPNFDWFAKRAKKEHKKLIGYRHPLVHYQTSNTVLKGSYMASFTRIWLDNTSDTEELTKLFKYVEELNKFVNSELVQCKNTFEKMVLVIEQLNTTPII